MGKVINKVTDFAGVTDSKQGEKAAKATRAAARTQAGYQEQALEYLKQRERLPQQFREGALKQLGGVYGLEGGEGSQQEIISRVQESPFYKSAIAEGEEALLRNMAATGGLRSGNTQEALADLNQRLLERRYERELAGLSGLANLPSNANVIAQSMTGIGSTLAQGIAGAAQAQIAGDQALRQEHKQNYQLVLDSFKTFSDVRLKNDIEKVGTKDGLNWYKWTWNKAAKALGLEGYSEGFLAHEVFKAIPEAVSYARGYMIIDHSMIGANNGR